MKTIEITIDGITALVMAESTTDRTEATTHEYPGSWETKWVYRPEIIQLFDQEDNEVHDITVEFENRILSIAEQIKDTFQ